MTDRAGTALVVLVLVAGAIVPGVSLAADGGGAATVADVTVAPEKHRFAGQLVDPAGEPIVGANGTIIEYYRDPAVYETVQTDAAGNFSVSVPNGSYYLNFEMLDSDDGMADTWGLFDYTVDGPTDIGTRTVPRGYNLTVYARNESGGETDAYIEVQARENGTWIYEYASGTPLDAYVEGTGGRVWYNVSRREVANGTYDVTVLDSWTRDVLGTKSVTVDGREVSTNVTVDRYNGTDISGAVGPSVVRDLPTDRDPDYYTLQGGVDGDVNVRLFLLNTSGDETVSVREKLPAGYEYVPGSIVADGATVSNVAAGNGELAFDVDGAASEVRYKVRTTDGGRDIMAFGGNYTVAEKTNTTLGDDVIDAGTPTLSLDVSPTKRVSEHDPLSISFTVADDTPSELSLTVENASTGEVVYRRPYSLDSATGSLYMRTWDATDPSGNPVPSGDYVVRLVSRADTGPDAAVERTVSVDTADPTVAVTGVDTSTSPSAGSGATVYTNGALGVDLTADGTPGEASAVAVDLVSRRSNFVASYDATSAGSGAWDLVADLTELPDDGTFDVEARAVDLAGNGAENATGPTVVLDREAPELRATVERIDTSTARVNVVASEELAVAPQVTVDGPTGQFSVSMMDNGTRRWNGTFNASTDGQYNLTATGRDRAGNVGSANASANVSTVDMRKRNVTVKMEPSGLFVRFEINDSTEATSSFVTMTGSRTPLAPLVKGNAGVNFLNAKLGDALEGNLTSATIGIPVDESRLPAGVDPSDVTIRYYDETNGTWDEQDTTRQTWTLPDGTTGEYWLANVSHFSTYGAVATDTDDPILSSATPTGNLGEGTTDATIRFDYADELSGVNASEVTLSFDGEDVTDDAASSVTGEYAIHEAAGLAAGDHTASVTVVDEAGNRATFDASFSVPAPSTPSEGPANSGDAPASGGGGGGALSPPSILVDVESLPEGGATVSLTGARSGETVRTELSGVSANGVSFTGLALNLAGEHGEFSLDLVPTGSASDAAPLPSETAPLTYLRVDHGVDGSVIGSAELRFAVDRSALPAGTTLDDVAVLRLHDGSWERIETERRGGRFTAETPGFSVFAVVVDESAAEFEIGDVTLGAEAISVGESVGVSATVTNPGTERRTREVALAVDGETVATERVELAPGASKTVAFEYAPRAAGNYEVSVGGVPAGALAVETDAATTETDGGDETTGTPGQPGFGILAALAALLVAALLGRRR